MDICKLNGPKMEMAQNMMALARSMSHGLAENQLTQELIKQIVAVGGLIETATHTREKKEQIRILKKALQASYKASFCLDLLNTVSAVDINSYYKFNKSHQEVTDILINFTETK
ncbi:MAG: four helix bundle protein [Barnesiella sp.]